MKKRKVWSLIGLFVAFSPLTLAASCNTTKSTETNKNNGDENQKPGEEEEDNKDEELLNEEIKKLTYTGLSEADFKKVAISDSTNLDDASAEMLGFILPGTIKKLISKTQDSYVPKFEVTVSKAADSLNVTYSYVKSSNLNENSLEVTVTPYGEDDLSKILEDLKAYNQSDGNSADWNKAYARGFTTTIDSFNQNKYLQITNIRTYAQNLPGDVKVYVRKEQNQDTVKYVVTKTLEAGKRILIIGDEIKVTPTINGLAAVIKKLKTLDVQNQLAAAVTSADFQNLEQARIQIIPDGGTPYDWSQLKITAPAADQLPAEDMLHDAAATINGKIEIEKKKGETTVHWYITYIDENDNSLVREHISDVRLKVDHFPTKAEVEKYDWDHATVLQVGDKPSSLEFATKPIISKIELQDSSVYYIYTNANDGIGIVQSKKYSGTTLDDRKNIWVASNKFSDIEILISENKSPAYDYFSDSEKGGGHGPVTVRYTEFK